MQWWMLPLAISVIGFAFARHMNSTHRPRNGVDWAVNALNYAVFGGIPSLSSWLAWSLMTRAA